VFGVGCSVFGLRTPNTDHPPALGGNFRRQTASKGMKMHWMKIVLVVVLVLVVGR